MPVSSCAAIRLVYPSAPVSSRLLILSLIPTGFGKVLHDHPLRSIKTLFDQALTHIDWKLSLIYSERGREFIPPERLLRALLLQILFSIPNGNWSSRFSTTCSIAGLSA
jgi:hypothetical protein